MELKEVASISGKSGLFKILKPIRNGVILESLDEQKAKIVANANSKVSILNEISMYTTGKVANTPLEQILVSVKMKHPEGVSLDVKKATDEDLRTFLGEVLPDFDRERVYPSDIKKLINWYNILLKYAPEALVEVKEEKTQEEAKDAEDGVEIKEKKSTKAKKDGGVASTKTKAATATKIKSTQNTAQKNVTKSTPSKRGG